MSVGCRCLIVPTSSFSAAASAASTRRARSRGAPVRVTLLDRHNYHLFQPLLYQVATASLSPADIASPIRWILRHQSNVQVLLAEAQTIEPERRRVIIDGGSLDYDYLIVATGAAHAYFGHPEWAAARARPQNAGRCAGDPAPDPARVRSRRARDRRRGPGAAADVRHHRRRTDRRRARRRARRDRAPHAEGRLPIDSSGVGAHRAAGRRSAPARDVSRRAEAGRARFVDPARSGGQTGSIVTAS